MYFAVIAVLRKVGKTLVLKSVLAISFRVLGVSAMSIGGSNFLFGIAFTGHLFDMLLRTMGLASSAVQDFATASVDSEFRFYSVFWFAYGAILWREAAKIETNLTTAGWLISLFAIGGIGRVFSYSVYGPPLPLFQFLTWIEIVLSAVMAGIWIKLWNERQNEVDTTI